jgi:hypothetical protein
MSAIAPAGSASSITGRLSAASTSATSEGDEVSEVISHPAPTSCIQVPMFDTMVAIHSPRKRPCRNGLQGDCAVGCAGIGAFIREARGGICGTRFAAPGFVSDETVKPGGRHVRVTVTDHTPRQPGVSPGAHRKERDFR